MGERQPPNAGVPPGDLPTMVELVAPVWSEKKVRSELVLGAPDVGRLRGERRLLGLPAIDSPTLRYPTFQFERHEGSVRVKPALVRFMRVLTCRDPWSTAIVLKTPAPELHGLTPLEWVDRARHEGQLLDYARVLRAEFER